jgi:hypothetical protein
MTAKELQKRNEKSQHLRVVQVDDNTFYVESSEGKICYRVLLEDDKQSCVSLKSGVLWYTIYFWLVITHTDTSLHALIACV